jgi:hypothetical protein
VQAGLYLDTVNAQGGSTMTVGGTLTNNAQVEIGNTNLSSNDSVTTSGLVNNGYVSMAPRFSSKVAPQNSPVWRVLAISRVGDRLLRFLAVGHGVSGSAEWDWRWRAA